VLEICLISGFETRLPAFQQDDAPMRACWHDLCGYQAHLQMISPPGFMSTALDLTVRQHHMQVACAADARELAPAIRTHAGWNAPARCCCTSQGAL
jgi:hypothetical protein